MLATITVTAVVEVTEEGFKALDKKSASDLYAMVFDTGIGETEIAKSEDQQLVPDDTWDDEFCKGEDAEENQQHQD